ncbi:hypothetical protein KFZ56_00580 [Virgibacillus sp. NKC19-3]|uniref:hypothetical protein n=1 Tax=Virgibacillus saliphilus TaxID=2831674 RepID=UPI001C9AD50A|nr:hypothetical protein [Virgibacillus sp. NKC19-3]MBY7141624.1 hypothetical protein [Virgibacillus sp. NKC19-3]
MGTLTAIAPVILVGGIAVFVIYRLKRKYNQGNFGKKESKGAQHVLDSLIPIGMLFGCAIGVISSLLFPISLLSTISLGAGISYLFGYFTYEIYSKKETIVQ